MGVSERKSQGSSPRGARGGPLLVGALLLVLRFGPQFLLICKPRRVNATSGRGCGNNWLIFHRHLKIQALSRRSRGPSGGWTSGSGPACLQQGHRLQNVPLCQSPRAHDQDPSADNRGNVTPWASLQARASAQRLELVELSVF